MFLSLLALSPATKADMYPDASNAVLPDARVNLGIGGWVEASQFGLVGDGKIATGLTTTADSATFSGGPFTSADITTPPKVIAVPGAGTGGNPHVTTLVGTTTFGTPAVVATSPSTFYAAPGRTCPVATGQSGAGNYVSGDVITLNDGGAVHTTCVVQYTTVVSATLVSSGTGCIDTAGVTVRFRLITGLGNPAAIWATVSGGVVSVTGIAWGGRYIENPTNLAAEEGITYLPDSTTNRCTTNPTFSLKMGVAIARVQNAGSLASVPADPVSQLSTSGAGTGATFNMLKVPKVGTNNSFEATISGTTMNVVAIPTGEVVIPGQTISSDRGVTPGTKIVSQLTGTTGGIGTYQVDKSQTTGSRFTASIAADRVMTVTAVAEGIIGSYQFLTGTGVSTSGTGTNVLLQLTGTPGGIGTYQTTLPVQTVASTEIKGNEAIVGNGPITESIWQVAGRAHYGTNNGPGIIAMMARTDSPRVSFPPGIYLLPCGQYEAASSVSIEGSGAGATHLRLFPFCTQVTPLHHVLKYTTKVGVQLSRFTLDTNFAVTDRLVGPQFAAGINAASSDNFSVSEVSIINVGNLWGSLFLQTLTTRGTARPSIYDFYALHPYPDSTHAPAIQVGDSGKTGTTGLTMNGIIAIGAHVVLCAEGGLISNLDVSYIGYGSALATTTLNITPNCRNMMFTGISVHDSMGMIDTNNTANSGFEIHGSGIHLNGARVWNNTGDGIRCQADNSFIRDVHSYNNGGAPAFDLDSAGLRVLGPNLANPSGCNNTTFSEFLTYDTAGKQEYGYKEQRGPLSNPLRGVKIGRSSSFHGYFKDIEVDGDTIFDHQGAAGAIHPGYKVDNWYHAGRLGPTGTGVAPGADKAICYPGSFEQVASLSAIGASVTTLHAANNFQLAIYKNGLWGRPSSMVAATNDMSTATAAPVVGIFTDATFKPQLHPGFTYWFCFNTSSASAIFQAQGTGAGTMPPAAALIGAALLPTALSATAMVTAVSVPQTYGTWPTWTDATAWSEVTTVIAPLIAFKVGTLP